MKLGLDDVAILLLEKFSEIEDSVSLELQHEGQYCQSLQDDRAIAAHAFRDHMISLTRQKGMYGARNERLVIALNPIPFQSWSWIFGFSASGTTQTILREYRRQVLGDVS